MPDLLSHFFLSFSLVILLRIKEEDYRKFFILGSMLPDISRIITMFPDIIKIIIGKNNFLNFIAQPYTFYILAEPLHTPFSILLISLGLSYFFNKKRQRDVFVLLLLGSVFHIFLDVMQNYIGFGILLLYPLSLKEYYLGLFEQSYIYTPFFSLGLFLFCKIVIDKRINNKVTERIKISLKLKNVAILLLILFFIFCVSFLTYNEFIKNNVHSLNFLISHEGWENKKVGLYVSEVLDSNRSGNTFTLEEESSTFIVLCNELPYKGEWISLVGTYIGNNKIQCEHWIHENLEFKLLTSLLGSILFIYYFFSHKTYKW